MKDEWRYIKTGVKIACKLISLAIGAPLGTQRGFVYRDFMRENDSISGLISLTQRIFKNLKMGTNWNSVKGTGLS